MGNAFLAEKKLFYNEIISFCLRKATIRLGAAFPLCFSTAQVTD
jgi:hypothetical protein